MKKKIVGVFVLFVIVVPTFSVLGTPNSLNHQAPAEGINQADDCGCASDEPLMQIIRIEDVAFLSDSWGPSQKPFVRSDLPPAFSWRTYNGSDWTTSVKDQGSCGSCWDFAAMGALECIIQIREACPDLNLDLSEQYVLSCLPYAGSCNGGWAYNAYKFIKSNTSSGNYCNGIIPECCFPYAVNDDVPCANVSPDWREFLIPLSTYGRWTPDGSVEDRNAMKTQIMQSGPIVTSMLFTIWNHGPENLQEWGYTHHDPTDYYPYPGPVQGTNHQVVIVGWKDDSSIAHGGYWIVKNSLSEEWGYDGFFNIEYGSLNIDSVDINWVEYHAENYSNWKPVARINGPTQGQPNQAMSFDGSDSFDHEGIIASYAWDLGDGNTASGAVVTHTYPSQGIYRVSLTVTDNASNTDTQTRWVFINKQNSPPKTPRLFGRRIGENGTAYRYTFWSADPEGDEVEYYLNWGDDYWFGGAAGWIGPYQSGEMVTLEKTWQEKGNYTVRVKAMDRYGAKSDWATLVVSMPVSYDAARCCFLERLFERFPNAFLLLRNLMGYEESHSFFL